MQRFFMYLDRYYVKHNSLPSLHASGIKFFKELVYDQVIIVGGRVSSLSFRRAAFAMM